jgi:hypothetical protein
LSGALELAFTKTQGRSSRDRLRFLAERGQDLVTP